MKKLNVNQCTKEELMRVPGIDEETARWIIDYREQHGPFRSLDDLANVRSIKEEDIDSIKKMCSV